MIETELKILNIDVATVTQKLLAAGALLVDTTRVIDRHFDWDDERLAKNQQTLRLRSEAKISTLTYKKGPLSDGPFKVYEEIETTIGDAAQFQTILSALGARQISYREKDRTFFRWHNLVCVIDQYPAIPPLLEIEGVETEIVTALQTLGYTLEDTVNWGANKVLKHYHLDPKEVRF